MFVNLRLSNVLGVCPDNWCHVRDTCFKFSFMKLNWTAAKSACETLGSKLVVINSQSEQEALDSKIPDTWPVRWIGLYQDSKNNQSSWLWVDGIRPNYTHWKAEEPDNHSTYDEEECAYMYQKVQWNHWNCTIDPPYICENSTGKSVYISCCSISFLEF